MGKLEGVRAMSTEERIQGETDQPRVEGPSVSGNGLARVVVRRFDPSADSEPYYQEYTCIPFEGRSVMEVLQTIYEEHDPSLAFRRLCIHGFCGSCFLLVNGEPVLSCQCPAQAEMKIEPHPKFPVIRDLVVDLDHPVGGHWERHGLSSGLPKAPAHLEG